MTEARSVLDKARSLESEARRLELGRKDLQDAKRIAERVQKLRAALGELRGRVELARTLRQRTGIVTDVSGVDRGRQELERKAAGGLPADNSFNVAERKIKENAESLSAAILDKWKNWADAQLSLLPTNRIAMLDKSRQAGARSTLQALRNYTQSARLSASDVHLFVTQCEGLNEDLSRTPDVPESLLTLLNRMSATILTLRDITDEEITLLRQHSVDQDIEIRRRSS